MSVPKRQIVFHYPCLAAMCRAQGKVADSLPMHMGGRTMREPQIWLVPWDNCVHHRRLRNVWGTFLAHLTLLDFDSNPIIWADLSVSTLVKLQFPPPPLQLNRKNSLNFAKRVLHDWTCSITWQLKGRLSIRNCTMPKFSLVQQLLINTVIEVYTCLIVDWELPMMCSCSAANYPFIWREQGIPWYTACTLPSSKKCGRSEKGSQNWASASVPHIAFHSHQRPVLAAFIKCQPPPPIPHATIMPMGILFISTQQLPLTVARRATWLENPAAGGRA